MKIFISGIAGTGKTYLAKLVSQSLEYCYVNLDEEGRKIFYKPSVKKKILNLFKTLNRKEISKVVFKSPKKLNKLNNIFYPHFKRILHSYFTVYDGIILQKEEYREKDAILFVNLANDEKIFERLKRRENKIFIDRFLNQKEELKNVEKAVFLVDNNNEAKADYVKILIEWEGVF